VERWVAASVVLAVAASPAAAEVEPPWALEVSAPLSKIEADKLGHELKAAARDHRADTELRFRLALALLADRPGVARSELGLLVYHAEHRSNDPVLARAAFALGWSSGLGEARYHYLALLGRFPDSPLVSAVYGDLGDRMLADNLPVVALRYYRVALGRALPIEVDYLRLQAARSRSKIGDDEAVIDEIRDAGLLPGVDPAIAAAARDLLLVAVARARPVTEAVGILAAFGPNLLGELGELYDAQLQPDRAVVVYRELLRRNPHDRSRCLWRSKLVVAALEARDPEAGRELELLRAEGRRLGNEACRRLAVELTAP
jgi:hypothetical protein